MRSKNHNKLSRAQLSLYIMADADSKIGTGHIMRCIALAQAWQDRGGKATFFSHCESDTLRQHIINEGFGFIAIEIPHSDPSVLDQTLEKLSAISYRPSANCWLVLDGYHYTPDYQAAIRDAGIHLLVIDDMNHLQHYHADILLNQNIHAQDLKYHCDEDTTLLLGTRYVLLRREFLKYRDFKHKIPKRAKNILVTLGGADPDNVTLKAIEALNLLEDPDISVKIIIGPANPHQEMLRKALSSIHFKMELLANPLNIPCLMTWADVAVSAGGSTCWELAFMELPSILIALSPDQQGIVDGLSHNGFALKIDEHITQDIADALSALIVDHEKRKTMSIQGRNLVDGNGACRVVKAIKNARS
jgi:UDP-2,4-diacetamido-2,4,6-trideoxy-beta-L-altropyranose hydrolase